MFKEGAKGSDLNEVVKSREFDQEAIVLDEKQGGGMQI
jgi:hypothetical protein